MSKHFRYSIDLDQTSLYWRVVCLGSWRLLSKIHSNPPVLDSRLIPYKFYEQWTYDKGLFKPTPVSRTEQVSWVEPPTDCNYFFITTIFPDISIIRSVVERCFSLFGRARVALSGVLHVGAIAIACLTLGRPHRAGASTRWCDLISGCGDVGTDPSFLGAPEHWISSPPYITVTARRLFRTALRRHVLLPQTMRSSVPRHTAPRRAAPTRSKTWNCRRPQCETTRPAFSHECLIICEIIHIVAKSPPVR